MLLLINSIANRFKYPHFKMPIGDCRYLLLYLLSTSPSNSSAEIEAWYGLWTFFDRYTFFRKHSLYIGCVAYCSSEVDVDTFYEMIYFREYFWVSVSVEFDILYSIYGTFVKFKDLNCYQCSKNLKWNKLKSFCNLNEDLTW